MDPVRNPYALTCVPRFTHSLLFLGLLLVSHASIAVPRTWAGLPQLQFDAQNRIGCRDVTPAEFAALNPDERLVEARFQVSALLQRGGEDDLVQLVYRIVSLRRTMRVVDYVPKTVLATDVADKVAVEEHTDRDEHFAFGLAAPTTWTGKATANGELNVKSQQSRRYELLPPLTMIAASGTTDRGYGVYFKVKPSRRWSVEGSQELRVVFRVARDWRGDCVHLTCQAAGTLRTPVPPLSETITCGVRRFTIALYAEGDLAAKAAAERLVRAESDLLRTVSANRREVQKRLSPTLAQKLGVTEPLLPANWAEQLIGEARPAPDARLSQQLPDEVQQAVAEYTLARRTLQRLGPAAALRFQ
jgi:hypothetical protein